VKQSSATLTLIIVVLLSDSVLPWREQGQQPRPQPHGRLFPPQDLGLLEAPDRDIWQHPDQVMDELAIAEASAVADIGAGSGWFTIRLARRVGPNGTVYAEDVQSEMLAAISRRVTAEGLLNVKTVLGQESDPRLPAKALDAVLMVDAYPEIEDRVTFLRNLAKALKPQGRLGVIDFNLKGGGPGPPTEERVSPEVVVKDAALAGLRVLSQETFLPYQYFLIFGLEPRPTTSARKQPR
jgi:ubiquinone/menaquinone biosynthesis C-methylase UbiE